MSSMRFLEGARLFLAQAAETHFLRVKAIDSATFRIILVILKIMRKGVLIPDLNDCRVLLEGKPENLGRGSEVA
jgi:hypothetical protein